MPAKRSTRKKRSRTRTARAPGAVPRHVALDYLEKLLPQFGWVVERIPLGDSSDPSFVIRHEQVDHNRSMLVATPSDLGLKRKNPPLAIPDIQQRIQRTIETDRVLVLDESVDSLAKDPRLPVGGTLFTGLQADLPPGPQRHYFRHPVARWHEVLAELFADEDPVAEENRPAQEPSEASEAEGSGMDTDPDNPGSGKTGEHLDVANWILADEQIRDERADLFGFQDYAEALAGLINNSKTKTPLVLAINAPWGAGKSSLGRLIQHLLETRPALDGNFPHRTLWFNAWMHDDAEGLDRALCAQIGQVADNHRPWWRRQIWSRRQFWITTMAGLLAILLGLLVHQLDLPFPSTGGKTDVLALVEQIGSSPEVAFGPLGYVGSVGGGLFVALRIFLTLRSRLSQFISQPKEASTEASMAKVRKQLGKMIEDATPEGSRFVIFIDDIERCRPPSSVDLLEAVNQLLSHKNVVIVLMGDMPAVAANVELKYEDLVRHLNGDKTSNERPLRSRYSYGRVYLQKIVQIQFDLPIPDRRQILNMLDSLTKLYADEAKESADASEEKAARDEPQTDPLYLEPELPFEIAVDKARSFIRSTRRMLSYFVSAFILFAVVDSIIDEVAGKSLPSTLRGGLGMIFVVLLVMFVLAWLIGQAMDSLGRQQFDRRLALERMKAKDEVEALAVENPEDLLNVETRASSEVLEELFEEQRRAHISSDSDLVKAVFRTVLDYLPLLPRNAKRLLNKLRVIILIAYSRGLLSGDRKLTPDIIGKWVVLQERWPEFGHALRIKPGILKKIEEKSGLDREGTVAKEFQDLMLECGADYSDDPELASFLNEAPRLSPAIETLVSYTAGEARRAVAA